jgi:branched-chain amino acid transport system permease protein
MSAAAPVALGLNSPLRRGLLLFVLMFFIVVAVGITQGTASMLLILTQATGFALVALGLNIQWGYGGLFNFAIMGFLMVGGASTVFLSYPVNMAFWDSEGPMMLGRALIAFLVGLALVLLARRVDRIGITGKWRGAIIALAWFVAYVIYRSQIDPAAAYIESTAGFVGGLGLHPILGWLFGGLVSAVIAFYIGKISLGLRTDYLAIATIGISEILRALIKNMDWLTRGTMTVSPMPWPTPLPQQLQAGGMSIPDSFITARVMFLGVALVFLVIAFILVQRAYGGPWGRMMRAIRDNHISAGSMGKDVKGRQL